MERDGSPEYIEEEIQELMTTVAADVANDTESGSDRTKIYVGHVNDRDHWHGDSPPQVVADMLADQELSIELIHIQEDIDEDEFQRRRQEEFENYVENIDTFFGIGSTTQEYLNHLADVVEAVTYPEEELRDKFAYMLDRLADGMEQYPETEWMEDAVRDLSDDVYVDAEEYYIPDESLTELQTYLGTVYEDVLGEYGIDVDVTVRQLSEEELADAGYTVDEILPPTDDRGVWNETLDEFDADFGYDDGTLPVFLSTRDMGYAFDGVAKRDQAFVHLPVDMLARRDSLENWAFGRMLKWQMVPHEVGHSALKLPHNAAREGIMSYNKVPRTMSWLVGDGPEICDWSEALCHRLVTGEDVPEDTADQLTVDHTSVFLEDLMDFEPASFAADATYVPEEDVVRYGWEFRDGYRTELDVGLLQFFDRLAMRTYKDEELVREDERTF